MPGTGSEVKTETMAIAILPGLLFINICVRRAGRRLGWPGRRVRVAYLQC